MTVESIDISGLLDLGEGVPRIPSTPQKPKSTEAVKPYDVKLQRTGAPVLLEHPCIVKQHEKFPETVVPGVPRPTVYNLSIPDDAEEYSVLWGRVYHPDGPTADIMERDSNFFEGAYYVNVLWRPVFYKQIISPKEPDYVNDETSI